MRTSTSAELMGWVMVLLGALLAIAAGRQAAGIFADDHGWNAVSATVIRTRLAHVDASSQRAAVRDVSSRTTAQSGSFRVFQEIVYFVKGNRYQASIELGRFDDRIQAAAAAEKVERAGTVTEVWVSSADPTQVTRHPQEREAGFGALTLFALLGMFALQFGVGIIRSASRGQVAAEAVGPSVHPAPAASR